MTESEQREAARQFYYKWNGRGREDEDARSYWIDFLQDVLGVEHVTDRLDFEKKVVGEDGNTKRIDVYIPETRVLIEQKSAGIALDKPQAGHGGKTPYEQAKEYDNGLPFDEKSRWIITSNFAEIWIYDMNQKKPEPLKLLLEDLQQKYHLLEFLTNKEVQKVSDEMAISLQAGDIVGNLYDAFLAQYMNPDDPETLKSLNKLCVRIVFCLYGEDAGIFGRRNMFHDYMEQFDAAHARKGLRDLFRVLDQEPDERDQYLSDDDPLLAEFPYVNGGLFGGEEIEIPPFTDEIMDLILRKASADFDWSGISPTIFGAVFESTVNPETRRSNGMHYTSIESIHKVIDPLFLDDLKAELEEIKKIDIWKTKERKLKEYQDKLASLTFLDPAVGSGNFLTESYTCIRKLENETIRLLSREQISFIDFSNPIKVSISNFYGIEINDFAVSVARTALWIAENQTMKATEDIIHGELDFLPLKTNAYIVEGNALLIDWNDVVPKEKLNYLMGNPPFVGGRNMNKAQNEDMEYVFNSNKLKALDYVGCWYKKATDYITGTRIRCAFVSTNSICQGEQVSMLWEDLLDKIKIDFAYQTFVWDSEASDKAHVHCVIVGFSDINMPSKKRIYSNGAVSYVDNINAYLYNGPNVIISRRSKPICDVPEMTLGNVPKDNGCFILSTEEKDKLIKDEPLSQKWIHRYVGSREYINNEYRWVLWLEDASPSELQQCPQVLERINGVRQFRSESVASATKKMADYPTMFWYRSQPDGDYLLFPRTSSSRRRYLPIGYVDQSIIASDGCEIIPNADMYAFGVLNSNVHNAWMRAVAGRLKSDYRYSGNIVYNNFVWPSPSEIQRKEIENAAQDILDARALYPDASLADLYDPNTMPPELSKAHQTNDRAVMQAYGMPIKETDEAACVAWLMRMYQEKTGQ